MAEADIQASALNWAILRSAKIYGDSGNHNRVCLIQWLNRLAFLPVFGKDRFLQQPVHVADLAWAVVEVLDQSATHHHALNISGASPLTCNEVVPLAVGALGKVARLPHLSAALAIPILQLMGRLGLKLLIKSEQIQRLNEDKSSDRQKASRVFGFSPIAFSRGIEQEVNLYGTGADRLSVTSHSR